jgi:23S rRNA (adenine2503-C2)-methyltransferase
MGSANPLIRSVPLASLAQLLREWDQPPFRAHQLADWLFAKGAVRWEEMTNLPQQLRERLRAQFELAGLRLSRRVISVDQTRKFLFHMQDGQAVESVTIPMEDYATFCLSCQVGCAMACRYCATARGGLSRQLESGEILEQVIHLRHDLEKEPIPGHGQRQFNLVFMGMGEPLDNWGSVAAAIDTLVADAGLGVSARRITISTAGTTEGLSKLLEYPHPVGLTVSLGGASDELRHRLMPVAGKSGLREILSLAEEYARRLGRRVSLALVLIAGLTDTLNQARLLVNLIAKRPFKVNLIPLNPVEGDPFQNPDDFRIHRFQKVLHQAGVPVFVRQSGGQDIAAACGQLRQCSSHRPGHPTH